MEAVKHVSGKHIWIGSPLKPRPFDLMLACGEADAEERTCRIVRRLDAENSIIQFTNGGFALAANAHLHEVPEGQIVQGSQRQVGSKS